MAAIALLPPPANVCGLVQYGLPLHENDHEGDARVDYQLSDKQSLFVRNMLVKQITAVPYSLNPANVLTANNVAQASVADSAATHLRTGGDLSLQAGNALSLFDVVSGVAVRAVDEVFGRAGCHPARN